MSRNEKWIELQNRLVAGGFLARERVQDMAQNSDVAPEITAAITAARRAMGQLTDIGDIRRTIDIDRFRNVFDLVPRRFCGVPDQGSGPLNPQAPGAPVSRWTRGVLAVSIDTTGCNYATGSAPVGIPDTPQAIIANAFSQWQMVSGFFSFQMVPPNSGEEIRVVFVGANVNGQFGSPGGVAASAGFPESGWLQFDTAENWNGALLTTVALHEVGHLLGLSHSNRPGGTMYPYASGAQFIDFESITAIRAYYGWQPQQHIGDRGTSHRAMLGVTSSSGFVGGLTPHMVWKGVGDDAGIYYSQFEGGWTPQQRISGVGCSFSPAITDIRRPDAQNAATGLFMAWKGAGSDQNIYWTRNLGSGWERQRHIAGVGTSRAPALARIGDAIYMAWKGVEGDGGIYWSVHNAVTTDWSQQGKIRGVGTSDSPALVALGGRLYMFWKGAGDDANAYYSSLDPSFDPIWKPQRRIEYFSYEMDGGVAIAIGTSAALSATVRGQDILLAWKGVPGDAKIWYSLFSAHGEFSGQMEVPNVGTSDGPSLVQVGAETYMAWKGVDGDAGIYWTKM